MAAALCFLLGPSAFPATQGRYLHHAFTVDNGLPADRVYRVAQSPAGYLLLGMERGVSRFDGLRFVGSSPAPAGFEDYLMLAEANGDLWISRFGPGGGKLCRLHNGQLEVIPLPPFSANGSAAKQAVLSMTRTKSGDLWIGGFFGGLIRLGPAGEAKVFGPSEGFPAAKAVNAILEARDGSLWMATSEAGVFRFDGSRFSQAACAGLDALALAEDLQGTIWAGTNQGVSVIRGAARAPAVRDRVITLLASQDGTLWIGTDGKGLIQAKQDELSRYDQASGLSNDVVYSLFEDRQGLIWAGTRGGLDRFTKPTFTTLTRAQGLPADAFGPMLPDPQGGTWLAPLAGGLYLERNGAFINHSAEIGGDKIRALVPSAKGGFWLARAAGGIGLLRDGHLTTFGPNEGLRSAGVDALWEDRSGQLWAGIWGTGVLRLEQGRFVNVSPSPGQPLPHLIRAFAETKNGDLWLADGSAGVMRIRNGKFLNFDENEGRPPGSATAIFVDGLDRVWMAGSGGLSIYHNGRFLPIPTHGLTIHGISELHQDTYGGMWLAGEGGIFRLAMTEIEAVLAGRGNSVRWTRFGRADGLVTSTSLKYSHPAILTDDRGLLHFASNRGISVVDPAADFSRNTPPPVIEQVRANGRDFPVAATVRLEPGTTRLQFVFTAIHLAAPDKLLFRYRLTGADPNWVEGGSNRTADYANLRPGTYHFQLAASLGDGVWTTQPTSLAVAIPPFFYQTYWFAGLLAAVFLLACAGAIFWRMKTMRHSFELVLMERTRIAREIHDTLLQGFAGIAWQLDALSKEILSDPATSKAKLDVMLEQLDTCLAEARETITGMRLRQPAQASLTERISALCAESPTATFAVIGSPRVVEVARAESIFSLVREAVRNSLRHAQARTIEVSLYYDASLLRLKVEDDGIGFSPDRSENPENKRWGLAGMRERVAQLGGTISIVSQPGQGTLIRADIPYQFKPSTPIPMESR